MVIAIVIFIVYHYATTFTDTICNYMIITSKISIPISMTTTITITIPTNITSTIIMTSTIVITICNLLALAAVLRVNNHQNQKI